MFIQFHWILPDTCIALGDQKTESCRRAIARWSAVPCITRPRTHRVLILSEGIALRVFFFSRDSDFSLASSVSTIRCFVPRRRLFALVFSKSTYLRSWTFSDVQRSTLIPWVIIVTDASRFAHLFLTWILSYAKKVVGGHISPSLTYSGHDNNISYGLYVSLRACYMRLNAAAARTTARLRIANRY